MLLLIFCGFFETKVTCYPLLFFFIEMNLADNVKQLCFKFRTLGINHKPFAACSRSSWYLLYFIGVTNC